MFFEPGGHKAAGLPYNPFKALIVPRPIGWISTLSREGVVNLAPYSFFNGVADAPPMVMFSSNGRSREAGAKDTQRNIEDTGAFVVNLATWDLRHQMNATSAPHPWGVDEMAEAGLTPAPSRLVAPPRVAESPAHLECRWVRTVELPSDDPERGNFVVFGQVVGIHIDERLIDDGGRVDITRARPLSRLGYMDYTSVETTFTLYRPTTA